MDWGRFAKEILVGISDWVIDFVPGAGAGVRDRILQEAEARGLAPTEAQLDELTKQVNEKSQKLRDSYGKQSFERSRTINPGGEAYFTGGQWQARSKRAKADREARLEKEVTDLDNKISTGAANRAKYEGGSNTKNALELFGGIKL